MKMRKMLWVGLVLVGALAFAAERGSWAIGEVNLVLQDPARGRKVEVLLLYPKSSEPLPWVVFSPGFLFTGPAYRSWGEVLASHGMAAALLSYAYSLFNPDHRALVSDLLFVLDTLPTEAQRLGVRLDPSRVALVGHSLGGKLSFLAAAMREVRAVAGLDPVDGGAPGVSDPMRFPIAAERMAEIAAPKLLIGAEYGGEIRFLTPCAPREFNYEQLFKRATSHAWEITQLGAGHLDYLDDPNCGFACSLCVPGLKPTQTRVRAQEYLLLFFRVFLLGEPVGTLEEKLSQDEGAGLITVRAK